MAHTSTTIYGSVGHDDIQAVLGESSTDNGGLCTSPKINKWAKFKPVKNVNIDPVKDYWKASNGRCGLAFPEYSQFGSMTMAGTFLYDITHNLCAWTYDPPTGGLNSPFRSGDFQGYDHECVRPIEGFDQTVYGFNDALSLQFEDVAGSITDTDDANPNLQLKDITVNGVSLTDYYLGVVMVKGSQYKVFTSSTTLGQGGYSITASGLGSITATEEWTCYPYLSSYRKDYNGAEQNGTLIPLDNMSFKVELRADSGRTMWIYGEFTDQFGTVSGEVVVENMLSTAVSFTSVYVAIVEAPMNSTDGYDGSTVGAKTLSGNWTVAPYSTLTIPFEVNARHSSGYSYWTGGRIASINLTAPYTPVDEGSLGPGEDGNDTDY